MATTVDDLRNQLSGLNEYVPESEETLRQRAVDIYSPQYQSDLNKLRDQIEFQVDRQQRQAVKTGMQRSSYNSAQQASIRRGGLQSQADLSMSYESNIANLLNDLMEKEKDRKLSADQYRDSLLLQLYNLENSGGRGGSKISKSKSIKAGMTVAKTALDALGAWLKDFNDKNTNNDTSALPPLTRASKTTTGPVSGVGAVDTDRQWYSGSLLSNSNYATQADNYTKLLKNRIDKSIVR